MTTVLKSIKAELSDRFKNQIIKFILVGSRMSNTQKDSSDFDIVVVTENSTDSYELIKKIVPYVSAISFQSKSLIGIYPIKEKHLKNSGSQFIYNVITKGVEF